METSVSSSDTVFLKWRSYVYIGNTRHQLLRYSDSDTLLIMICEYHVLCIEFPWSVQQIPFKMDTKPSYIILFGLLSYSVWNWTSCAL